MDHTLSGSCWRAKQQLCGFIGFQSSVAEAITTDKGDIVMVRNEHTLAGDSGKGEMAWSRMIELRTDFGANRKGRLLGKIHLIYNYHLHVPYR